MSEKIEIKVSVGCLPNGITKERIKRFFSRQGEIVDVRVSVHVMGVSVCVMFQCYLIANYSFFFADCALR
jgi:hypothetical protein